MRKDIILLLTIITFALLTKYICGNNTNYPTAIDVYQGKTTLEITYRDSIPVDSVVVYKPEFRK